MLYYKMEGVQWKIMIKGDGFRTLDQFYDAMEEESTHPNEKDEMWIEIEMKHLGTPGQTDALSGLKLLTVGRVIYESDTRGNNLFQFKKDMWDIIKGLKPRPQTLDDLLIKTLGHKNYGVRRAQLNNWWMRSEVRGLCCKVLASFFYSELKMMEAKRLEAVNQYVESTPSMDPLLLIPTKKGGALTRRKSTKRKATRRKSTKRKANRRKSTKRKAKRRKSTKRKNTRRRRR